MREPTRPPAAMLVPPRVACEMSSLDARELDRLIRSGAVRVERVDGKLLVALDDVEQATGQSRKEVDQ